MSHTTKRYKHSIYNYFYAKFSHACYKSFLYFLFFSLDEDKKYLKATNNIYAFKKSSRSS